MRGGARMSDAEWMLRRQYLPSAVTTSQLSVVDDQLKKFVCSKKDEYNIEGEMGMPLPPFAVKFNESLLGGHMLGVADEDGHLRLIDTSKHQQESLVKEWSAHSNAVFDLSWVHGEPKLVTASGDQTARLWDTVKAETLGIFRGHTCSLKSVCMQPRSTSVFASGSRDGNILMWDSRSAARSGFHAPVATIEKAHALPQEENFTWSSGKKRRARRSSVFAGDSRQGVTCVLFQDSRFLVTAGACDGTIKLWDVRRTYSTTKGEPLAYHTVPFPSQNGSRRHGYASLAFDSTRTRLFAVSTNDRVFEFCCSTPPTLPVATYRSDATAFSFYVKAAVSPCDRYLLCGSGDNNAYIWRIGHPSTAPWLLDGHLGEVTSVAWSPVQHGKIVTCSDDNTFRVWRMQSSDLPPEEIAGKCTQALSGKVDLLQQVTTGVSTPRKSTGGVDVGPPTVAVRKRCQLAALNLISNKRVKYPPLRKRKLPKTASPQISHASPVATRPESPFTIMTPKRRSSLPLTPKSTLLSTLLKPLPAGQSPQLKSPEQKSLTRARAASPGGKLSTSGTSGSASSVNGGKSSTQTFMEKWLVSPKTPKRTPLPSTSVKTPCTPFNVRNAVRPPSRTSPSSTSTSKDIRTLVTNKNGRKILTAASPSASRSSVTPLKTPPLSQTRRGGKRKRDLGDERTDSPLLKHFRIAEDAHSNSARQRTQLFDKENVKEDGEGAPTAKVARIKDLLDCAEES